MLRIKAVTLLLSVAFALQESHKENAKTQLRIEAELRDSFEPPEVFPVPTTSRCIVIIVCQYMLIYIALAACRTYHEFSGSDKGRLEAGLSAAAQTLTYGPMLCVLFIACRMRVEFLSDGKGQPPIWVQSCMYALTFSVLASSLVVLLIPVTSGKVIQSKEGFLDLEVPKWRSEEDDDGGRLCFFLLTACRYSILVGLYGGLAGGIIGICTYLPPGATDFSKLPPPAPAVMCTMTLAVLFFMTQLVIAACRSYAELTGVDSGAAPYSKTINVMNNAATTVEFAPMLAIVFLAARMRALQHDSQPQSWAQQCMYAATGAMCTTTLLAIIVPLVLEGKMETNDVTSEATFRVPNKWHGCILIVLRFVCMLGFYGGVIGVICSIFTFEAPGGQDATLPVSPTVRCVVNLSSQFFFVYFVLTVFQTVWEVSGGKIDLQAYRSYEALKACKATLGFAPMLAILFVTTRMYALLITNKKGEPQAWVQDGMYMATWSLLITFLSCLITAFIMEEVHTDADGNIVNKFQNPYVAATMTVIRYIALLLLYGGVVTIIIGLFVMTPETANGRGSIPLFTDAVNSTPLGEAPPGPNHVAKEGQEASKFPNDMAKTH